MATQSKTDRVQQTETENDIDKLARRLQQSDHIEVSGESLVEGGEVSVETISVDTSSIGPEEAEELGGVLNQWASFLKEKGVQNMREVFCAASLVLMTAAPAQAEIDQDRPMTDFTHPEPAEYGVAEKTVDMSRINNFKETLSKREIDIEQVYTGSIKQLFEKDYEDYPGGLEGAMEDVQKMRDKFDGDLYGEHNPELSAEALSEPVPVGITNIDDLQHVSFGKKIAGAYLPSSDGVLMPEEMPQKTERRSLLRQELLHRWQVEGVEKDETSTYRKNVLLENGIEADTKSFDEDFIASKDSPGEAIDGAFKYMEYLGQAVELDARLSMIRKRYVEEHPGERIDSIEDAHKVLDWGTDPDRALDDSKDVPKGIHDMAKTRDILSDDEWENLDSRLARRLLQTL